jgi:hypothetical protein
VSIRFHVPSLSSRAGFLCAAMLTAVGVCTSSEAQTAPQLLPYTITTVAGGGTTAIANGAICPVSGYTSTDAYGDGCQATEVKLSAPRFVTTDKNGVVFFSDSGNGLVRRIDPITGIITAVAGGAASSPSAGTVCGTGTSLDTYGDGCLGTAVKISKPEGLAFSAAGDLYFADNGYDNIRKVAATGGVITTTGTITSIAGSTTYGYNVNNTAPTGSVIAATQSYLNFPYGIAFDAAGNLYVADEGNNALSVINLTAATETIQGMTVPAGTIAKFVGYGSLSSKSASSGDCPDFVSTSSRGGCYFGSYAQGAVANKSNADSDYDVAVDAAGNVYFVDEFLNNVAVVTTGNVISTYAGIESTQAKVTTIRATAGTFGIGSNYNLALDKTGNLYTSDAVNGVIWRVDGGTKSMYVIAGGAANTCSAATNAVGDGCPATSAKLSIGTINSSGYATAPGVAGLFVDPAGSLYITDATTSLVRVASSGTQFGAIGNSQPTQIVDVHFAAGDAPATSAYSLTAGTSNFTLGTAACTANSDKTTDCQLPVTATPSTLGLFTGTLQVTSSLGATASFNLSGTFVRSPITRTAIAVTSNSTCTGTSTYSTTTPLTITATVSSSGGATGTVTFFANGTQIGTAQTVTNGVATLTYTFATAGNYSITAKYSGDGYFTGSTGVAPSNVVSSAPTFTTSTIVSGQSTVSAGQTGLYSFSLVQSVYAGTISLSCSGLPTNSSCSFSPSTIAATGCSTTNTITLSILTQPATKAIPASIGMIGRSKWSEMLLLPGLGLALLIGLQRRRLPVHYRQLCLALALLLTASGLVACGNGTSTAVGTPSGSYTVTVTASGSTGNSVSFTVPLTVK